MEPQARVGATRQPRGRPRASARWDGTQWVLDPDAVEQAEKRLLAQRKFCRDRNRATRALLKQVKPALFEKTHGQAKLTQYAHETRMSGSIKATEHKTVHNEVCSEQSLVATGHRGVGD